MALEEVLLSCPPERWQMSLVVAFDWYDGPRQGIASMSFPQCEFVFDLVAERFNPSGLDDRLFRLSELPRGSMQSVLGAISQLGEPVGPLWAPVWQFPSDEDRQKADTAIRLILSGRRTSLVVLTQDMLQFTGIWSIEEELSDQDEWFSELGIL